jgi:hypothetical protein
MEYKFVTSYNNKFYPCILDTFDNYVRIKTKILKSLKIIGRLKNAEGSPWPAIKVYQYIGREDAAGLPIYEGHILQLDNLILTVRYNVETCAFEFIYVIGSMEFVFIDLRMINQMYIINHVDVPEKVQADFEEVIA